MEKITVNYSDIKDALQLQENRYVTSEELKKRFSIDTERKYKNAINYLTSNKYLITIFRGFFYIPSLKERKYGISLNIFESVAAGMQARGIHNWYFGGHTAIKMNNLTHEYFGIIELYTDVVKKSTPIHIMEYELDYVNLKSSLFSFGLKKNGKIRYSDLEKTILDMIYLGKKRHQTDEVIKGRIIEYVGQIDNNKIQRYLPKYPRSVGVLFEEVSN